MKRNQALAIAFCFACAGTSYLNGTLGGFLLSFALIMVGGFIAYVTTWKALTWWHYGGGYRVRRFVRRVEGRR